MFNSKYPIICAPMNQVSDLNLALACVDAGIVPSLIPSSYSESKNFLKDYEYIKSKKNVDVLVALDLSTVVSEKFLKHVKNLNLTHIELLAFDIDLNEENIEKIFYVRSLGIKIIAKLINSLKIPSIIKIIDAVTVKGSEGAGRVGEINLTEEIKKIRFYFPNITIIASGGIKDKNDVDILLNSGANFVSIGTLFALSKESSIPESTKINLLNKNVQDISKLDKGAMQRAVVFDKTSFVDDYNNTQGLITGIKTGTSGHIFMGNAISTVNKIYTVKEIVKSLI